MKKTNYLFKYIYIIFSYIHRLFVKNICMLQEKFFIYILKAIYKNKLKYVTFYNPCSP